MSLVLTHHFTHSLADPTGFWGAYKTVFAAHPTLPHSDEMGSSAQFQKFLDSNQYSLKGIKIYEEIFGPTYVSTGGQETTAKFCQDLGLRPDHKVHSAPLPELLLRHLVTKATIFTNFEHAKMSSISFLHSVCRL